MQVLSAVQARSASHAWPTATQTPAGPAQPEVQRWSAHTGWPGCPHGAEQVPASPHATPAPVHRLNGGQQAWPALPQLPQLPFMHCPLPKPALHELPLMVQRFPVQQPPAVQAPPAQHGWFGPPHVWHEPKEQSTPASAPVHVLPAQHG